MCYTTTCILSSGKDTNALGLTLCYVIILMCWYFCLLLFELRSMKLCMYSVYWFDQLGFVIVLNKIYENVVRNYCKRIGFEYFENIDECMFI